MLVISLIIALTLICVAVYFFLHKNNREPKYAYSTRVDEELYDNGGIRRSVTVRIKTRLSDNTVVDEVLEGEEKYFYPSGTINRLNNWKEGKLEGDFVVYYEDGGVYITGSYKHNKLNSQYMVYNKEKELIWSNNY